MQSYESLFRADEKSYDKLIANDIARYFQVSKIDQIYQFGFKTLAATFIHVRLPGMLLRVAFECQLSRP